MSKTLIVACNEQQMKHYAERLEVPPAHRIYIHEAEQMRGYREQTVYFVGEWYTLPDSGEIRSIAESGNNHVEYMET